MESHSWSAVIIIIIIIIIVQQPILRSPSVVMIHDLCHCASNNNQESRASSSGEDETIIMSIYPEDLLESSQQEALSRFRLLLTQEGLIRKRDDDNSLLRFLRARAFNIAKAKAMFEAMLEWRKEIGADTIKEVKWSSVPVSSGTCLSILTSILRVEPYMLWASTTSWTHVEHVQSTSRTIPYSVFGLKLMLFCLADFPVSRKRRSKGVVSTLPPQDR